MKNLSDQISKLELKLKHYNSINFSISSSSVGWHIDHTLLTIRIIIDGLKKSNPSDFKNKFNFPKLLVFTLNRIPRGRAKAPKIVQPNDDIAIEKLKNQFEIVKSKLSELKSLHRNNFIEHPYFGNLNSKSTIKFLRIHTDHHLKIINDIIKDK